MHYYVCIMNNKDEMYACPKYMFVRILSMSEIMHVFPEIHDV